MGIKDLYILCIRMAGMVLAFFWITSAGWGIQYIGSADLPYMIVQFLAQGLLLYLMLFKARIIASRLFNVKNNTENTGFSEPERILDLGILFLGLIMIVMSLPDLIQVLFSGHKFISGQGENMPGQGMITLDLIRVILGLILIFMHRQLSAWLRRA